MGARITIHRLVEWPDTDASGHYQNSAVLRWIQAAEAELHRSLGIAERTFGSTPRVRLEIDFRQVLWFLDEIAVDLEVEGLGRTSCRQRFRVRRGEEVVAEGRTVIVYVPKAGEGAVAWPDDLRAALDPDGRVEGLEG